jgi:hypothetical protein
MIIDGELDHTESAFNLKKKLSRLEKNVGRSLKK